MVRNINLNLLILTALLTTFISINSVQANCPAHTMNQGSATGAAAMMENHSQMMLQHLGQSNQNYDLRFMNMMIMHHQAAVKMAQDALSKAQHPELKQMAQNIINSQSQEIQQMKIWRKQWYGQ